MFFIPGFIFIYGLGFFCKYNNDSDLTRQFYKELSKKKMLFSSIYILIFSVFFIFFIILFCFFKYESRYSYVFYFYDSILILHYHHIYSFMVPSLLYFLFLFLDSKGQLGKRLMDGLVLSIESKSKACFHVDGDDLGFIREFIRKDILFKLKIIGIKEIYFESHLLYDGDKNKNQEMIDMAKSKNELIKRIMDDGGWFYMNLEGEDVSKMSNFNYFLILSKITIKRFIAKYIDKPERAKKRLRHIPKNITKMEKKLKFYIENDSFN